MFGFIISVEVIYTGEDMRITKVEKWNREVSSSVSHDDPYRQVKKMYTNQQGLQTWEYVSSYTVYGEILNDVECYC